MKKYIIKYADGSEQTVMQAIHESRKEAGRVLMRYLSYHNENWDVDDYLSPFDFKLEEVECKEVNEVITDFESARKALAADFYLSVDKSKLAASLMNDINPKHVEALDALNKLFTIAQAWNKEDDFVPDFSNEKQNKWYLWFKYNKDSRRFICTDTFLNISTSPFGTRLCFKTSKRAEQFGKQFADLYNKVFL